jgi:hypothetical protein
LITSLQGCNIADIEVVVQWKAPTHLSSWVQRAGRVARGDGRTGYAVLLVEKSAFEVDPSHPPSTTSPSATKSVPATKGKARGARKPAKKGGAKLGATYAVLHGQKRGLRGGVHDAVPQLAHEPELTDGASAEGLYIFIQTTICRRQVLTKIYRNKTPGGS